MSTDSLEAQAALLGAKELWIQQTAHAIVASGKAQLEAALIGARWASLWRDELEIRAKADPPDSDSAMRRILEDSKKTAQRHMERLPSYPTGIPSLRIIIAANEAFCMSFDDEDYARELLNWP